MYRLFFDDGTPVTTGKYRNAEYTTYDEALKYAKKLVDDLDRDILIANVVSKVSLTRETKIEDYR
jgi:hypothetical protein